MRDERAGGERNSRTHPPLDEGRAISDQTVRTGSTDRKRSIWMFDDRKSKPEVKTGSQTDVLLSVSYGHDLN